MAMRNASPNDARNDAETTVLRLANGVRIVAIALPHLESVNVSVFVRTGSSHESRRLNGISHFVEHMAFKGTLTRSCQEINLDAERLGADVNAHTDKDHTAYHMRGLAVDAPRFVSMLGDIVRNSSFPEAELERERQVILHELIEDEEDVLSTADKLFDRLSFGNHPIAQPVIGTRLTIQHIGRDDLLDYVGRQYSGANVVVGVVGRFELDAVAAAAEAAFAGMVAGAENVVETPAYVGGVASRVQPGYSQTNVVLGFPIASLREDDHAGSVAAALFGEGMSSPLMDEIRERRGLVYYASCAAEVNELCGQFVVEASTSPAQLDEFLVEVRRLLVARAGAIAPAELARAKRQIAVRTLRAQERPSRRLEDAALDLFVHGRVRTRAELLARAEAIDGEDVRAVFAKMLAAPPALAIAGRVTKGASERARALFVAAA
ncbi:MAG: pitrilysin family protein [Caldimonas sp.]